MTRAQAETQARAHVGERVADQVRPRHYPPTPYPPGTPETARYRDGWDLGWRHMACLDRTVIKGFYTDLPPGPYRHGYAEGLVARSERIAVEAVAARRHRAEAAAARRQAEIAEAVAERPY